MKYLEELPETVVGVKLSYRHELKRLSLTSPLTKYVVFLFLTGAHGGKGGIYATTSCDPLPYQQVPHKISSRNN